MYLAPEVVRGKYAHAADVWSAGIIACLLLTGRLPFSGEVRATLVVHTHCTDMHHRTATT